MNVTRRLKKVLRGAYPCPETCRACRHVRYNPGEGLLPRGFAGAFGGEDDVQLIICLAEPGEPGKDEAYNASLSPSRLIDNIAGRVAEAYRDGQSPFHRRVCYLLDHCWPGSDLEEQLRRTWITETTLCSAHATTGPVDRNVESACASRFLAGQLAAYSDAFVIALGKKAETRLKLIDRPPNACARAAGSPLGQRALAERSWRAAARAFRRYMGWS